jgi:preprotein translocase subunit Sec63
MQVNTLQETLDTLLAYYNVKATVDMQGTEIQIALTIPSDSSVSLSTVRQLILEHLSTASLRKISMVKIFNREVLEPEPLRLEQVSQRDIIHEIFRIPNQCLLSPAEMRTLLRSDRFLLE